MFGQAGRQRISPGGQVIGGVISSAPVAAPVNGTLSGGGGGGGGGGGVGSGIGPARGGGSALQPRVVEVLVGEANHSFRAHW
jgi:hypothetical protein